MTGKKVNEIQIGERAIFSKTISESDVYLYAGITGDFNPAHVNKVYAENTFFQSRIAHGLLAAGLISTVIGTKLPGPGTIYIEQDLSFTAPVYIGDTISAHVRVLEVSVPENRVALETICKNQNGKVVIEGKALVAPPKK